MPSNHLILCCPHSLLLPTSIFPSIRVFRKESVLHIRRSKYWSLSFIINPSNDYSGLISFRMDCFDPLAVQETLKCLIQQHHPKASLLQHSAFFTVQLLHPYMTIENNIALTRWTFVGKVISPLFNMLARLVISFLPRSKCLNFMAAVTISRDFGGHLPTKKKKKICHCFHYFPIYLPWGDGTKRHDLSFLNVFFVCVWMSLNWQITQQAHFYTFLSTVVQIYIHTLGKHCVYQ